MGDLLPGDPEVIGSYRLVERIGAGGMGVVYLARADDGRSVALKVIRPELAGTSTFRRRFVREVSAARRVRSAVTVEVVDADADAEVPWVAFEYVPGPDLDEIVSTRPPRLSAAVGILSGIAEALAAIHEAGLVHRDLKPSNILCPPEGVKVIDFGIAAAVDLSSLTGTGGLVGTPAWLAPEQITGEVVSPATDVFAWGCVAVYVLTGHLAFGRDGDPAAAVLYRIANGEPDLDGVPEPLLGLVTSALAKRPDERPAVASLLASLLPGGKGASVPQPAPSTHAVDGIATAGSPATVEDSTGPPGAGLAGPTAPDDRGAVLLADRVGTEGLPASATGSLARRRRRRGGLVGGILVAVAALAAGVIGLSGRSRGTHRSAPPVSATTASTVSLASFGQQYLAIVTPANQAIAAFSSTASTLPASATGVEFANLAAASVAALDTAIQALLRVHWPRSVLSDVRSLVAADSQLATDLQDARLGSYPDAVRQFEQDIGRTGVAGSAVRADLGLPPPRS